MKAENSIAQEAWSGPMERLFNISDSDDIDYANLSLVLWFGLGTFTCALYPAIEPQVIFEVFSDNVASS